MILTKESGGALVAGERIMGLFQVDHPSKVKKKHLTNLIAQGVSENLHLEFKEAAEYSTGNCAKCAKALSAFANSDGGILVLGATESGVTGKPSTVTGIDGLPSKVRKESVQQKLFSLLTPWPDTTYIQDVEVGGGLRVFLIDVPGNHYPPVQVQGSGIYYYRTNAVSSPMPHYMVQRAFGRGNVPSLQLITHIFGCQTGLRYRKMRVCLRVTVRNTGRVAATGAVVYVGKMEDAGRKMDISPMKGTFVNYGEIVHPDTHRPMVMSHAVTPVYLGIDMYYGDLSIILSPSDSIRIGLASIECPFKWYKLDLSKKTVDQYVGANGNSTDETCPTLVEVKSEVIHD